MEGMIHWYKWGQTQYLTMDNSIEDKTHQQFGEYVPPEPYNIFTRDRK